MRLPWSRSRNSPPDSTTHILGLYFYVLGCSKCSREDVPAANVGTSLKWLQNVWIHTLDRFWWALRTPKFGAALQTRWFWISSLSTSFFKSFGTTQWMLTRLPCQRYHSGTTTLSYWRRLFITAYGALEDCWAVFRNRSPGMTILRKRFCL